MYKKFIMNNINKRHEKELKRLAKIVWLKYRLHRKMGSSPKLARVLAHFSIMVLSGGRKNLFAENLLRRYQNIV